MTNENELLISISCGMFAAILSYVIYHIYNKHNNKTICWNSKILIIDYIILIILINGIITAVLAPLLTNILNFHNLFFTILISICIYGGINFLFNLISKRIKQNGNFFILLFAIIIIVLTIANILLTSNIGGIHIMLIAFSIFNFYYYKKHPIPTITFKNNNKAPVLVENTKINKKFINDSKNNKGQKKFKNKINNRLLFLCIFTTISIIAIITIALIYDYQKEKMIQEEKTERIRLEQSAENNRQKNLLNCYNKAEKNRINLWNANCDNGETNCSLPHSTIDWIDNRYKQDINNCNSLYN